MRSRYISFDSIPRIKALYCQGFLPASILNYLLTAIMKTSLIATSGVPKKDFWAFRCKSIPTYNESPWIYYERFVELGPNNSLVLCNDGTEVRTLKIYKDAAIVGHDYKDTATAGHGKALVLLLGIQHPNFVAIKEAYIFKNETFAIVEYVGFSVDDLLRHSISLSEREIAYITSQVSSDASSVDFH